MAEYIDRKQAIKYFCTNMNWYDADGYITEDGEKVSAITDLVNGVPTADVIPLETIKELRSLALRVKHNTGSIDTLIDKLDKIIREC